MCHWKSLTKNKYKLYILAWMWVCWIPIQAQTIVFINPNEGKIIHAKEGDMLSIRYKGYLGQTEYFKNTLTLIGDSSFILGIPFGSDENMGSKLQQQLQYKEIKYSDVIAFRRSGMGRTFLKSTLSIGAIVGSFYVLNGLYTRNQVSDLGKIGLSLGVGLSFNLLINVAFPDKPNHKMKDGWQIKTLKE